MGRHEHLDSINKRGQQIVFIIREHSFLECFLIAEFILGPLLFDKYNKYVIILSGTICSFKNYLEW